MMNIESMQQQAFETKDYSQLLDLVPYARFIGMQCQSFGDEMVFHLPTKEQNMGNPMLPAIHGGVLSGFMEMSAIFNLMILMQTIKVPKIIDFTVDYLRAGQAQDTYCECKITRQGRRVANVHISCWQTNRKQPIAMARAHFLLAN